MKNESPRAGALIFYASGYGQAPFVDDVRAASRVTILPLLKPTIATVTIIDTMAFWNDYLLPSLVLHWKDCGVPRSVPHEWYGSGAVLRDVRGEGFGGRGLAGRRG